MNSEGRRELALFVFVPFCKIKCTYCDFNAYANLARIMEPYARAVVQEIERWHDRTDAPVMPAKSIYFGGGTPSIVPVEHIGAILQACTRSFPLLPDAEITVEANPGTVDLEKLDTLRSLGVNRLSLGVQAFDDAVLKRLNRGHTVADALRTLSDARRAGFDNINLDLIYGLPLQTMDDWQSTVGKALALAPEHLSLYALTIEQHTGLAFQIARGKYPRPDDDLAADMYSYAETALAEAGYEHYEISNWGKRRGAELQVSSDSGSASPSLKPETVNLETACFASRHNLTYWRNEPYLGFGAGAHSCFGGERYWNVLSPVEYVQRIDRSEGVVGGREEIPHELEMAEGMILGLRLSVGVSFREFEDTYGEDPRVRYAAQFKELDGTDLLEWTGERVCLTPRGRLLSNEVFWRLLPD